VKRPRNGRIKAAAGVWLVAVLGLFSALLFHSVSPGSKGIVPVRWPAGSALSFDASRLNLILFAHPRCPCTQATLGELEILMADCEGKFSAQVWFIRPPGTSDDWTDTALWHRASSIPGVKVGCDENWGEARRFGAQTSGLTLLYDRDGKLLFHGGITGARGHSGDNAGRSAVAALSERRVATEVQTPVFGCPLFAPSCQEGGMECKP
jgi:hypothetical protein